MKPMSDSTVGRQRRVVWQSRPDRPASAVSVSWHGKATSAIPLDKVDTVKVLRNGGLTIFEVTPGDGFAVQLMLEAIDTIMASEQIPTPFQPLAQEQA
jgi:hypothetical protein